MSGQNKNDYHTQPIHQTGGVKQCCVCQPETKRHVKRRVKGLFGTAEIDNVLYWCEYCGLELTTKDMDRLNESTQL